MENTSMGFFEAVKSCFSKAFVFSGRARRSEYWWWTLFSLVVGIALSMVEEVVPEDNPLLMMLYGLGLLAGSLYLGIATIAVTVRRLHDTGRSGWWYGADIIARIVWTIWIVVEIVTLAMNAEDELTSTAIIGAMLVKLIVSVIPFIIYNIVLLVWYCTDSQPGANKYGENPKGVTE